MWLLNEQACSAGQLDQLLTEAGLYQRLIEFVRKRIVHPEDAEDLVQQILLKVLNRPVPEHGQFVPWLFTVARNAVVDALRAQKTQKRKAQELAVHEAPAQLRDRDHVLDNLEEPQPGPQEIADYLASLLQSLETRDQEVLYAVDVAGRSQRDFAAQLGVSYPTLKSRVQRARKKLRAELARNCELVFDGHGMPVSCEPKRRNCCQS